MAAVSSDKVAATLGYQLSAGKFSKTPSNLPQRVAVICGANAANNAAGLNTEEWEATNLKTVGSRYGYGSPAYLIARVAMPILNGIPLVFYPQEQPVGGTAKIMEITPVGTATESATHYVKLAGRLGMDGQFYAFSVVAGDTAGDITAKIATALVGVLGCPCNVTDSDYSVLLESKWKDETANKLTLSVFTDGNDAGISYIVEENVQAATGVPSIADALDLMDAKWNTLLINAYGTNSAIASALETWNGKPGETPTGRYTGTIMKPLMALIGSYAQDETTFTDAHKNEVTLSISPMPLGKCLPFEMAADDAAGCAVLWQDKPALDVLNRFANDIVAPESIGEMSDYLERDRIVKLGNSTVYSVNNQYQYKDPVTTYHPEGELVPAWRWRRDLMVDFNLKYRYRLLEETFLVGKVISGDADITSSPDVIKPVDWKAIVSDLLITPAIADGLVTDKEFTLNSLVVQIDATNPNRFNTWFDYKKTGVVRISATEVKSGFSTFSA